MSVQDRGFASMDRAKQRAIASAGGKAAHRKGTAHEWTTEEARDAGRKGGLAARRNKQAASQFAGAAEPADSPATGGVDHPSIEGGHTDLGIGRGIKPPFE